MAPFPAYGDHRGDGEATGTPLVLVHGHPFDRTMRAPRIEAFSASRRVVAPDPRGYGASPADSTLCVVEGAAHMPNRERPETLDAALGEFLARVDAKA